MATVNSAHQIAVANLYVALFNRAPDASGFEYWSQALANGASTWSIAGALLKTPESVSIYGPAQSAADFVATFYQTVLNRAPDADGLAFWTEQLMAAGGVASNAAKAQVVMKMVDIVGTPLPVKPAELSDAQYAETVRDREIFREKTMIGIDFAVNLQSNDLDLARQAFDHLNAPAQPSVPAEPAEPTVPTTPVEPTEPAEPTVPADPGTPTEPTLPTEPVTPAEPTTPVDPAPVDPEPVDPKPTEPTTPTTPAEPTPTEPTPTEPTPTEPTPTEPTPNEPTTPTEPVTPVEPEPEPEPEPTFKTFTLTTGGDKFTGAAGDDIFLAPSFSGVNSINTHDNLDGGDGIDTLNIGLAYLWREIPTLNNIEIVNVTTQKAGVTLDLRESTGVTQVGFTGGDDASDGAIFYVGDAALSVTSQNANATFSGSTATSLSLALTDVGRAGALTTVDLAGADPVANARAAAHATSHDITAHNAYVALAETTASAAVLDVNVAATGSNALTLSAADAATVQNLSVTGSGSVDFSGRALSGLKTFQGGDGGVTLAITELAADARIELGAGDNVITLARGSAAGAVIIGGDGDDVIHIGMVKPATTREAGTLDTLTGGAGRDTFTFNSVDSITSSTSTGSRPVYTGATTVITDFETGVDQIQVAGAGAASVTNFVKAKEVASDFTALLATAKAALDGSVQYYVGQVGADAFLMTDLDGAGFTNIIQLNNVGLAGIDMQDITLFN